MPTRTPLFARFAEFELDEANARLARGGRPVDLPPKAFAVLCALVGHGGRLVAKDALLDAVWGHQHISESVLKTTISQVRAALDDDAKSPRFIETAPRRGYRFIAALAMGGEATGPQAAIAIAPPSAPASGPGSGAAGTPTVRAPLVPVGMPAALTTVEAPRDGLVGRNREVAFLASRLYVASGGARRIVFVAGEPGIGKTTLIERFIAAQSGAALKVATGQCIEHFGAAEPYMPVLEALNALARDDGGTLVPLMRRVAPTWLVQLPWYVTDADREQLQREVAGATQDRMLREFGELVDRCAKDHPLVLVLEDLHWSDHATVQLIGYLARRKTSRARLLVVGSFRPTEIVVADHPLKALRQELRLHRLCDEIDLEAFAESDVGDYLTRRFDGEVFAERFVRALHAHTEGLPLFVVNVVDELLAEARMRRTDDGKWLVPDAGELGIPENIVGVIERHLSRLPADKREWLVAASVVGAEFVHTHVADAIGAPPDALHDAFDRFSRQGEWVRALAAVPLHDGRIGSRFAFRHALYRHVLYLTAGAGERMQLHRRVAEALTRCYCAGTGEIAAELALHYERAGDLPLAIQHLQVAAARALGRFAAREAARSAQHALALLATLPDANDRLDAELELRVIEGVALTHDQMYSEAQVVAAFERAQELCDVLPASPARARALHGLWWVRFGSGDLRRALALATRIAALADTGGDATLQVTACIALGSTLTHMGQFVPAQQHLERGLAVFESAERLLAPGMFIQDPGVELMCYLSLLLWWCGEPDRARAHIAAAVTRAERLNHPLSMLMSLHFRGVIEVQDGRFDAALATSGKAFALLADKSMGGPAGHAWVRGLARAALGDVDGGLAQMRDGTEDCLKRGMMLGLTGFYFLYAEGCCIAGRYDEAERAVDDGLALAASNAENVLLAPLHRVRATALIATKRYDAAAAELATARTIAAEQGARCFELGALLTLLSLPQVKRADAERAIADVLASYGPGDTAMQRDARMALAPAEPARASAPLARSG